jgi:protein ImuA
MSLPLHLQPARALRDLQPLVGGLGLQRARLHEVCGPARHLLAALLMAKAQGPVVWIRPGWWPERLNTAGLQPMADPGRLLLLRADRDEAALWAAEEALRSGAVPLVVVETSAPPGLTPVRRLHLAAGAGAKAAQHEGSPAPLGLLLSAGQGGAPGVETRWQLAPAPSRSLLWSDDDCWTLIRLRARLEPPAAWALTRDAQGAEHLAPLVPPDLPPPDLAPHTTR